jgi:hypothetical protein
MITLSTKDADFILKYIRADLEKITEAYSLTEKKKREFIEELKEEDVKDDSFEGTMAKTLIDLANAINTETSAIKEDLTKCVELLTVGSEAAE